MRALLATLVKAYGFLGNLAGSPDTTPSCTHMDATSVPWPNARPAAKQAKFDEIQPPCMTPIVYAAGSRELCSYLLIDYLSAVTILAL